jgi:flagellar FliJ protein
MPKFTFRLQQFLGVKEQLESQKEMEYGKALQQLERERQRLRDLVAARESEVEALRLAVSSSISPIEVRRHNNIIEKIKGQIIKQEEHIREAERFAEVKRLELVQAMKERQALETVHDRQKEEFLREADLAERKITDELVSYKYTERGKNIES